MSEVICTCFDVTREDIVKAIADGATSLEEVQNATNAGQGCGTCLEEIVEVLKEELS